MTHSDVVHVRVGEPSTLIDAVPYLLGFHPHESLVLLGLGRRRSSQESGGAGPASIRRVEVILRVDIPVMVARPGDFDELLHALGRSQVSDVVCVWLTNRAGDHPQRDERLLALSTALCEDAHTLHIDIMDVLVASHDRWWSLMCSDRRCCPEEGTPRPAGTSVVATEAVLAGLVALPGRASVQSQLVGDSPDAREGLRSAIVDAVAERQRRQLFGSVGSDQSVADDLALFLAAARRLRRSDDQHESRGEARAPDGTVELPSSELARLGAGLGDLRVRDDLWLRIDEGCLEADGLLYQLVRRLPRPYDAPALFLFGWSQWRRGDGTLAAMAAERALESNERYSAADLLLATVRGGLDPRRTPPLRRAWDAVQS